MARPFPFDDTNDQDPNPSEEEKLECWYELLYDMQKDDQIWNN